MELLFLGTFAPESENNVELSLLQRKWHGTFAPLVTPSINVKA